jgi:plastocyanin
MKITKITTLLAFLAGCLIFAGASSAIAQTGPSGLVQVIALDECDPTTFNAPTAAGADFCKNVALANLGFATTLSDLITAAQNGTPDPGWDFEPDQMTIQQGTILSVVNEGGEPHTFTEVQQYGGGFVPALNPGGSTSTVPECSGGFKNIAVARTRVIQGSRLDVAGLSKGKHFFQCCIHPWMRIEVDVK